MIDLWSVREIVGSAHRIIWFEPPEKSLQDPVRFMAYAMRYASHEDMVILRKFVSDQDFETLLDKIPPGIVDARSWAYWNAVFHRYPAPPMPVRKFD